MLPPATHKQAALEGSASDPAPRSTAVLMDSKIRACHSRAESAPGWAKAWKWAGPDGAAGHSQDAVDGLGLEALLNDLRASPVLVLHAGLP